MKVNHDLFRIAIEITLNSIDIIVMFAVSAPSVSVVFVIDVAVAHIATSIAEIAIIIAITVLAGIKNIEMDIKAVNIAIPAVIIAKTTVSTSIPLLSASSSSDFNNNLVIIDDNKINSRDVNRGIDISFSCWGRKMVAKIF